MNTFYHSLKYSISAAAILIAILAVANPAYTTFHDKNGLIAFSSNRSGNFEIYHELRQH